MRKVVDKKITYNNTLTSTATDQGLSAAQGKALKDTLDTKQGALTFGIGNTNAVKIDSSSVADNEFARFTANGLESLNLAEMKSALGIGAFFTASFTEGADNEIFTDSSGTFLTGLKWIDSVKQFQFKNAASYNYNQIPIVELLKSDGTSGTNSSFSVTRLSSYMTASTSYQYLTGGTTRNSNLDMTTGNFLKVRLGDWSTSTYWYDIEVFLANNTVSLQIDKKGVF